MSPPWRTVAYMFLASLARWLPAWTQNGQQLRCWRASCVLQYMRYLTDIHIDVHIQWRPIHKKPSTRYPTLRP
eukprot:314936-Pyramimonas_sp.AAC.1